MRKNTKMKSFLSIAAVSALMLVTLAGCGDGNGSAGTGDAVQAGVTSTSNAGTSKNTLIFAGEGQSVLNPLLNNTDDIQSIIFSGLMKYDGNNKPVTDLAESYEYDENTKTYTFHLRDGVKWHDGEDFTADDVVFTYKALTEDESLSSGITSNYEDIKSITAPDKNTVVIQMEQDNAAMLDYFTIGIIPKHLLEGKDLNTDSFNQNPVGTGRYKLVSWDTAANQITLIKNDDYYGKVPNIENIIFKNVTDENTKATMMQAGEADLVWLNASYASTFKNNPSYNVTEHPSADWRGISLNFKKDFWSKNKDSAAVLNYALDKNAILNAVVEGEGEAAYSPIQTNSMGGNTNADIYSYNLNKFAQEMEKLGWTKGSDGIYERNGQKFRFNLMVPESEVERVDIAKLAAKQLQSAGIDMKLEVVSGWNYTDYDAFLAGQAYPYDADALYAALTTNGSGNSLGYSNQKVDELLESARHETDVNQRKELYGEFEEAFSQEPGSVLICYLDAFYVSDAGIKGIDTNRLLDHHARGILWNVEEWTLE